MIRSPFRTIHTEELPGGLVDVRVHVMPWENAAKVAHVAEAVLFIANPERRFRVRADRMPWSEFAARVLFVATVVGCLLVVVFGC